MTGLLTWATTSIGPAPRISITLGSTDYRNHLNVPINGYGDRAIGRLAAIASAGSDNARKHISLSSTPVEFATADDILSLQFDRDSSISIVFLSAHGVSTANGPAILPANAKSLTDAVEVAAIINRLSELPHSQHKVLLIDGVHSKSIPAMGILNNDFARQMRDLDEIVESIPNLVVIVSADVDQQSWANPEQGTTVWAAALIDALSGSASDLRNDGWIDLSDVHQWALRSTEAWANKYVGEKQQPLRLPSSATGEARSREIALYAANQPSLESKALHPTSRKDLLGHWWGRHHNHKNRDIHPSVTAPVLWQHFEATLLRLEQFELAGCQDAANSCARRMHDLDGMLSLPTLIDSIACRIGVLNPELVGFNPSNELIELAKQLEISLSGLTDEDAKRHWSAVIANQQNPDSIAYLRHWLMISKARRTSEAIRESRNVDRKRLQMAASLIDCIRDPMQPPPQIGLILKLLARDLPHDNLTSADADRIARWLELCVKVESITDNRDWWAPTIAAWTREKIVHADYQRRLAGDLLFGDTTARSRCEQFLTAAEEGYESVTDVAETISKAETVRYTGRHQLRRLHSLCASALNAKITGDVFFQTKRIITLYSMIDEIESILDSSMLDSGDHNESTIANLNQLTSRFVNQLDDLKSLLERWQSTTFNEEIPNYSNLLTALSIDGGTTEDRLAAWSRLNRFIASGAERADSVISTKDEFSSNTKYAAARGELALAAWPSREYDQLVAEPRQTKAQVQHRLKTFEADPQWWVSLQKLGSDLGRRETALQQPELMIDGRQSVDQSWRLHGSSVVAIESARLRLRDRQKCVGRFLAFQAERFYLDGLWSYEHTDAPYYRLVSELLKSDSIALSQGNIEHQSYTQEKTANQSLGANDQSDPMGVDLIAPRQITWTTQQEDSLSVAIKGRSNLSNGFATLWARTRGSIHMLQPGSDERACWSVGTTDSLNQSELFHYNNPWLVAVTRENQAVADRNLVEVFAYFRGRRLNQTVELNIFDQPDVQVISQPKPKGGRIAIRSLEHSQSGRGSAVTIVLDCSGSMGAKPGEAFGPETKYSHAVAAVEKLLDSLPTGTDLSIWAFGQATGPNKTVRQAEQSIRQVQSSVLWDADDSQLRSQIVDSISYPRLEPWNESPLFATILAASSDLKDYNGTRSLIVITDGHDNRIANDPVANPLSLTEEKWLEKYFNGTGITVNVIAFRVETKDKENTRRQLTTVQRLLPPGKFVEIDQAAELALTLRQLISVTPGVNLHRIDGNSNRGDSVKLAISNPADSAITWTNPLNAGLYKISGDGNETPTLIEVRDGNQLVLADLSTGSSNLSQSPHGRFDLWPMMQHELKWCSQKQAGRWQIALQPLVSSESNKIEKRLILWAPSPGDSISVQSPRGLWIEATQNNKPLPLRWQSSSEQSGASFDITAARMEGEEPELKVWISDQPAIPVASLRKGTDFSHIADLSPAKIQVSGGDARLLSASIETHAVFDSRGEIQSLPCMVLRAEMPAGSVNFFRTEGLFFEGFDEQYYRDLGQYTLRLWPVTAEQVEKSLSAINLISIDDFKKAAERNGGVVTFEANANLEPQTDRRVTAKRNVRSMP